MSDFESLFEWGVDVDQLPELRDRLRARPEYPLAARRLAENMLRDAESDPSLDGMLKDAGRTVAGLSVAYLDASGGVTLARLKAFLEGFGLVSKGRARSLLSLMRYLGYMEPDPTERALKPAYYRLAPRFHASYVRHEESLLDAARLIEPGVAEVIKNLGDKRVFDSLVVEQGVAFAAGSRQAQEFAAWYAVFMHRNAGIQIIHAMVAEATSFPPRGPIAFSIAATAKRFGVSRAHVTRMKEAAVLHGFMEPFGGSLRFTETGRAALDWLYASRLCVHLSCAARTLKAHPELWALSAA